MYNKKISVLIPAYNEEKTIGDCLEELVKIKKESTYPIEIIVCNNGSTDKTTEIVKQFPGVLLVHEKRRGTNYARQAAFEFSTGDIIACIDADCVPSKNWISRGASYFIDTNTVSVSGICIVKDYPFTLVITGLQAIVFPLINITSKMFQNGGIIIGGNVFISRYALKSIGGFDTSRKFWGDDARMGKLLSQIDGGMHYSLSIRVTTSSRRFRENGFWKTSWNYSKYWIYNFFDKNPNNFEPSDDDIIR